jgi:hypothetical protein
VGRKEVVELTVEQPGSAAGQRLLRLVVRGGRVPERTMRLEDLLGFPLPPRMDRKVPWLKYVLLATARIITVPIGFRCLVAGGTLPLYLDLHWPGTSVISLVLAQQNGLPTPASQV